MTSLVVALGGLFLGHLSYRNVKSGAPDPLKKPLGGVYTVLYNKYYFDELYQLIFIRPAIWISDVMVPWFDRNVIDGVLHLIARQVARIGLFLRNYIDKPIVNGSGDLAASIVQWFGRFLRPMQTGKVQQYMILALVGVTAFSALFYYLVYTH